MIAVAWLWFECLACRRVWKRAAMARFCLSCRGELTRIADPERHPKPYSPAWLEARALTALIVRE